MLHRDDNMTMKTIEPDEIFQNLKGFLKTRGIDLQDGSYTRGIRHGCGILADTVNLSQRALARAKTEMGKRLGQVRQVIHEKTGPPPATRKPSPREESGLNRAEGRRPSAKSSKGRARGSQRK
jgi:hypothetical protein